MFDRIKLRNNIWKSNETRFQNNKPMWFAVCSKTTPWKFQQKTATPNRENVRRILHRVAKLSLCHSVLILMIYRLLLMEKYGGAWTLHYADDIITETHFATATLKMLKNADEHASLNKRNSTPKSNILDRAIANFTLHKND